MVIGAESIEALAPDAGSLAAATKLLKAGAWSDLGAASGQRLIWGECQGSGANPYRVAVDLSDLGSKCTCPSRKFPCKHALALALMLMRARGAGFTEEDVPDWVMEWMGRRRKVPSSAPPAREAPPPPAAEAPEQAPDPRAEARREAARARREAETAAAIRAGLTDLEGWVSDQLRAGLTGLLRELPSRCRRIAARMVDAKAGALASRIDEMPSRVLALPQRRQADALVAELGNLILISRAWGDRPEPGLRREVTAAEPRDTLLADPGALRAVSCWEVLATRERTRRDGLIAQATWLLNLGDGPDFALLLDHFPAATGRRGPAFAEGERFGAELVFHPSRHPLRAVIAERRHGLAEALQPAPLDPLAAHAAALRAEPWLIEVPLRLPAGRLKLAPDGGIWWEGGAALPVVASEVPEVALGLAFESAAMLWDGHIGRMLAAWTPIGRIGFRG